MFNLILAAMLATSNPQVDPAQCFYSYQASFKVASTSQEFQSTYDGFSACASKAIYWIHNHPKACEALKEIDPYTKTNTDCWSVYFGSAVGASFSQMALAVLTKDCSHYSTALDNINQAELTEQGERLLHKDIPVGVDDVLDRLKEAIKQSKEACIASQNTP